MFRFKRKKDEKELTFDLESGCYFDVEGGQIVVGHGTQYGILALYDYGNDIIQSDIQEDDYEFLDYEKPSDEEIKKAWDLYFSINGEKLIYFYDKEKDQIFELDSKSPEIKKADDSSIYFEDCDRFRFVSVGDYYQWI